GGGWMEQKMIHRLKISMMDMVERAYCRFHLFWESGQHMMWLLDVCLVMAMHNGMPRNA
ncbi:hypothetical protein ACJX0J_029963, partial [Zea mays]